MGHPLQQNTVAGGTAAVGATEQEEEEPSREGVGVPFVSLPAALSIEETTSAIRDSGLPSPEEV